MTDDLFEQYFSGTREERARRLDDAAIADPHVDSSAVDEVARFLATMLEYEYVVYRKTLRSAARKLLREFRGDEDDLWDVMEARARDAHWLRGVIRRKLSPWLVVEDFIGDYARRLAQERKRQHAATTAGRIERYAGGRYEGLIQT